MTHTSGIPQSPETALPQSISLWRNFSQWLGGMGILVMLTLLLRGMGGSSALMKLEAPGIVKCPNCGAVPESRLDGFFPIEYTTVFFGLLFRLSLAGR